MFFKLDYLTDLYISQAQNLNTLQIGTGAQADYARSVTFLFAVCALVALMLISFLSLSAYSLINKDSNPVKTALKALLLNLPGFIVLYANVHGKASRITVDTVFMNSIISQLVLQLPQ